MITTRIRIILTIVNDRAGPLRQRCVCVCIRTFTIYKQRRAHGVVEEGCGLSHPVVNLFGKLVDL